MRRIIGAAFTPRRAERWKPVIEAIANELIDDLEKAGPPADLVAGYCFALPVRIICRMLGVPERDALRFRVWSNAFAAGARMTPEEVAAEVGAFLGYMSELIAAKRAEPGEDLIDDLIAARDGADRLTEQGAADAGDRPDRGRQRDHRHGAEPRGGRAARRGPRSVATAAPRSGPGPGRGGRAAALTGLSNSTLLRIAVDDVELASGTVRTGQVIAIPSNGALRDPEAYPDPDTIRFDRDAPPTLIFGGGPHYCLGAHLAKAELTVGLSVLLRRLPTLRMTVGREELEFSGGEIVDSMIALPVAW